MSNDNRRPMSPFARDVFEFATDLSRAQVEAHTLQRDKPFIIDRIKRPSKGERHDRR